MGAKRARASDEDAHAKVRCGCEPSRRWARLPAVSGGSMSEIATPICSRSLKHGQLGHCPIVAFSSCFTQFSFTSTVVQARAELSTGVTSRRTGGTSQSFIQQIDRRIEITVKHHCACLTDKHPLA